MQMQTTKNSKLVKFEFQFNNQTWYWTKVFHGDLTDERIKQYIEQKTLPFELDSKVIKHKIL